MVVYACLIYGIVPGTVGYTFIKVMPGYARLLQVVYRLCRAITCGLEVIPGYYMLLQVMPGETRLIWLLESDKRLTRVLHKVSAGLCEPYLRLSFVYIRFP